MFTGQSKAGAVVIEVGGLPRIHRVARIAGSRKTSRTVIRIRCFLELRKVATNAGIRGSRIFATNMAGRTLDARVLPRQRKLGAIVIKGCWLPGVDRMAAFASRREAGTRVIRVRSFLKIA